MGMELTHAAASRLLSQRTVEVRALLPTDLAPVARNVFAFLVTRHTDAGQKPVPLTAKDVAKALDVPEAIAHAVLDDLHERGLLEDVADASGGTLWAPAAHTAAGVIEGRVS